MLILGCCVDLNEDTSSSIYPNRASRKIHLTTAGIEPATVVFLERCSTI